MAIKVYAIDTGYDREDDPKVIVALAEKFESFIMNYEDSDPATDGATPGEA